MYKLHASSTQTGFRTNMRHECCIGVPPTKTGPSLHIQTETHIHVQSETVPLPVKVDYFFQIKLHIQL